VVDGVLDAWSDGHDLAGLLIDLAIDELEPRRPPGGYVELDPRQPGEIASHLSLAQVLADHPV